MVFDSIELNEPDSLVILIDSIHHVDCPGDIDGAIYTSISGGTPPYQYFWSTGSNQGPGLTDLSPGTYDLSVADARGCKVSLKSIEVASLNLPLDVILLDKGDLTCKGDSSGYISIQISGGIAPFWFNWSAGVQHFSEIPFDTLNMLAADSYSVTVTDSKGCIGLIHDLLIHEPEQLGFQTVEIVHNQCFGHGEGFISLEISGGTPPYTYLWNDGSTELYISDLVAGSYQLQVLDSLDCQLVTPIFTITEPDSTFISYNTTPAVGNNHNGTAFVSIEGGFPPYQYLWDDKAGSQSGALATGLAQGYYTVSITDDRLCLYVDSVYIDLGNSNKNGNQQSQDSQVFPNPAHAYLYLQSTPALRAQTIRVFNDTGQRIEIPMNNLDKNLVRLDVHNLLPGIYLLVNGEEILLFVKI
jgi:hypothetical protein